MSWCVYNGSVGCIPDSYVVLEDREDAGEYIEMLFWDVSEEDWDALMALQDDNHQPYTYFFTSDAGADYVTVEECEEEESQ